MKRTVNVIHVINVSKTIFYILILTSDMFKSTAKVESLQVRLQTQLNT